MNKNWFEKRSSPFRAMRTETLTNEKPPGLSRRLTTDIIHLHTDYV